MKDKFRIIAPLIPFFNRFLIGVKHAWNIPTLPSNVLYFHTHIFTRVFRVLGGISIVALLSGSAKSYLFYSDVLSPLYYFVLFFGQLHFIYIITIKIIKSIHMIKVWRSGKLDVRNSPLDKFATTAAKLFHCWKFGCEIGSAGLGIVGSGFLLDQILEAGGKEKVFTPLIGNGVKFLVKGKPSDGKILLDEILKQTKDLDKFKQHVTALESDLEYVEKGLENNSSLFSKDDLNSFKKGFKDMKDADNKKLSDMAKVLADNIKNYSEKK